jgi:hypothetical protein
VRDSQQQNFARLIVLMCINVPILAGTFSRILSKIYCSCDHVIVRCSQNICLVNKVFLKERGKVNDMIQSVLKLRTVVFLIQLVRSVQFQLLCIIHMILSVLLGSVESYLSIITIDILLIH